MSDNISTIGLNGEYLDPILNNYYLGNGYRAYNPTTMQFNAPDDMSPFGHGGINPYMYCSGDPINNTDPTGHFIFGLDFSILVEALKSASPIVAPEDDTFLSITQSLLETTMNVSSLVSTDGLAIPALAVAEASLDTIVTHETENVVSTSIEESITKKAETNLDSGPSRLRERLNHMNTTNNIQSKVVRDDVMDQRDGYIERLKKNLGEKYKPLKKRTVIDQQPRLLKQRFHKFDEPRIANMSNEEAKNFLSKRINDLVEMRERPIKNKNYKISVKPKNYDDTIFEALEPTDDEI